MRKCTGLQAPFYYKLHYKLERAATRKNMKEPLKAITTD
jgi:hypothetical protein